MKDRWKQKLMHVRKRLALLITSLVGSGAMLGLFGASAAMALTGRGCLALPFHGSAVVFPSGASTVGVRFQGEANDQAVSVTVNGGKISPNPTPGEAGLLVPNLRTLFVQQLPFGKSFDFTVNVPRAAWPDDDVMGFAVTERFANTNNGQILNTVIEDGTKNPHFVAAVADRPDASRFPNITDPLRSGFINQTPNTFLSKFLTNNEGQNYYNAIGAPQTFGEWKTKNGFPSGEVVTVYRNEFDLGFGREMHCRIRRTGAVSAQQVSCYVTNYANENDAEGRVNPLATVCMEYDAALTDKVRFYVYDTGRGANQDDDRDGRIDDLLTSVALDSQGKKSVPGLCLNCHGGSFDGARKLAIGSHFLPFDTKLLPVPFFSGDQAGNFKQQNQMVWHAEGAYRSAGTTAITELTEGWYKQSSGASGLFDTATAFNPQFVPAGWGEQPTVYLGVVAPYCRTCHTAQVPRLSWNTKSSFYNAKGIIQLYVCDQAGVVMPHAQRTYQKFWESGARAHLAFDLGIGSCKFDNL